MVVMAQSGSQGQANAAAALAETRKRLSYAPDESNSRFTNKYRALVLDSTYQPIDVITWQRAICLELFDKVDVLEYYDMYVKSAYDQHLLPAVLRVRVYVARNRRASNMSVSRRNVMLRDCYTCQYCGTNSNLTIDHVVPASKGGKWEWTNLVTACIRCNGKKGAKSLKQLKWTLKKEPREPSPYELGLLLGVDLNMTAPPKEWLNYIYELKRKSRSVTDEELTEDLTALAEADGDEPQPRLLQGTNE